VCVCVWNLITQPAGRTYIESVWERSAEENIWTCEE